VTTRDSNFGPFIADRRASRGLDVDELARETGVDAATVNQWESGEKLPSDPQLARLSRALDVHMDELFEMAGHPPADTGAPGFTP
jgi:transcriptional regulator with XRE-family HTH domain